MALVQVVALAILVLVPLLARLASTAAVFRTCAERGDFGPGDVDNMLRISKNIIGNTICPLGDAAALPVISYVTKFRSEFEDWVRKGRPIETIPVRQAHIGEPAMSV